MQEEDCKGWLLTCDQNREKQALKDAYNFLTNYIEELYDDLVSEAIQKKLKEENKQLSLQTELKQAKKVQNRLLFSIQTNVKCVIFVKINEKFASVIDPNLIVYNIMEDVWKRNKDVTRFCHKILPVERAFKAEHFKMLDVVDELFEKKTQNQKGEIKSWSLNFKCRNNSKFNYKQVLRECDKIAAKYGHFADIFYPQWTINIEITNHLMCISLSDKYKDYNQYKLHKKVPKESRPSRQQATMEQKQKEVEQKLQQQEYGLKTEKQLRQMLNKEKPKEQNTEEKPAQIQNSKIQIVEQKQVQGSGPNVKLLKEIIKPVEQDDVDLF